VADIESKLVQVAADKKRGGKRLAQVATDADKKRGGRGGLAQVATDADFGKSERLI